MVSKDNVETGLLERNESVFLIWVVLITINIHLVNYSSQSSSEYIFHLPTSTIMLRRRNIGFGADVLVKCL